MRSSPVLSFDEVQFEKAISLLMADFWCCQPGTDATVVARD
jgi:hypothetical protein